MNRRKFFAGIAAAITATVIPIKFPRSKGLGFIASAYSSTWNYDPEYNAWWSAGRDFKTHIGARELAALERAWKECTRTGQAPSQIYITDEQLAELTKK